MKRVYFNNAAGAFPLAPGVAYTVAQAMLSPLQGASESEYAVLQCRVLLAKLMKVSTSRIILTSGATVSLNTAIMELNLKQGDLVVTTEMEHTSVLNPLERLQKLYGVKIEYIPVDDDFRLNEDVYNKLLAEKPKFVALTHANSVTGRINPVSSLLEKAKAAGAFTLLDASQTMGRIPVLPEEFFADMVAVSGYKGLRGPFGAGALYISPNISADSLFEANALNTPAFSGLSIALSYYMETADEVAEKEWLITSRLVAGLMSVRKVKVLDQDPSNRLPIVSFTIDGVDSEAAKSTLFSDFGIECSAGLHSTPLIHRNSGTIRFSPSYINSKKEIDYVIDAVRSIAE